jgi:16S rRNA (guanine527-N7)-methyltransferase
MVRADIELTLVESVQKKANFLNQAVRHLGLDRTVVLGIRAEEIRDRQFDVVLCRLLGKIREVVPLTAHVLSPQGRLIFYKTPRNDPEMKQAQRVLDRRHLRIEEVRDVHLRFPEEFVRRLVVIARTQ